ncbi:MAG: hypothetical protein HN691_01970 [Bacteroidetes bacterium]|jgi:hypothetical protein|nr:hypothetical protein [Bacteroidota bacterium]MBT7993618.1 hypothetical protein [Bacteroidota bacterium]
MIQTYGFPIHNSLVILGRKHDSTKHLEQDRGVLFLHFFFQSISIRYRWKEVLVVVGWTKKMGANAPTPNQPIMNRKPYNSNSGL